MALRLFFYIFLVAPLVAPLSQALAASCVAQLKGDIEAELEKRASDYKDLDSQFKMIKQINRPKLHIGKKREAVFLVHGFMGSPDEMSSVAKPLIADGYTVYLGLIPGYGATPEIANQVESTQYRKWYIQEIKRLEDCYDKVHLVGFSTGALLAFDYVTTHPKDFKIRSVSLISPYFTPNNTYTALLQSISTWILDSINVETIYALTCFPDIEVMVLHPSAYLNAVPLMAADQVKKLGFENSKRKMNLKSKIPALALISENDRVIRWQDSQALVEGFFSDSEVIFFDSKQKVPHHMMSPWVSPVHKYVEKLIHEHIIAHRDGAQAAS